LGREDKLIKLIKSLTGEELIGDDCAVLPSGMLVSSDMLVQGKHFLLPQMNLNDLGWKALAVNLSDIAAMGAQSEFAVVNIAFPTSMSDDEFEHLYKGIIDCAKTYNCRIVGGDLTGSDALVISITVFASSPQKPMLRSAAKAGYKVIVSGDFGASAMGLQLILQGQLADATASHVMMKHLRPKPRLLEAKELHTACMGEGALMDASDGLADALLQIAEQSGVAIQVEASKIPVHKETVSAAELSGKIALRQALYGGEDYELVACIPSDALKVCEESGFTCIGNVLEGSGVRVLYPDGSEEVLSRERIFQHWI